MATEAVLKEEVGGLTIMQWNRGETYHIVHHSGVITCSKHDMLRLRDWLLTQVSLHPLAPLAELSGQTASRMAEYAKAEYANRQYNPRVNDRG